MINFPLFFPNSKFLQKKSWHKIIWLVSFVYSAASLYSVLIIALIWLDRLGLINIRSIEVFLTLPMLIPLLPLLIFTNPERATLVSSNNSLFNSSLVNNSYVGLLFLMAYFAFSTVLPSIIYKILLDGVYGQKWQKLSHAN